MAKEPVNQQKTIGCVFVVRTFLRANLSKTAGHTHGDKMLLTLLVKRFNDLLDG